MLYINFYGEWGRGILVNGKKKSIVSQKGCDLAIESFYCLIVMRLMSIFFK